MTKKEIRAKLNAIVDAHLDYCRSAVTGSGPLADAPAEEAEEALSRINAEINATNTAAEALGCDIDRLPADALIIGMWRNHPTLVRR